MAHSPADADSGIETGTSRWVFSALLPLAVFGWALLHLLQGGGTLSISVPWVPSLDLALAFRLDGLALQFVMLISGVGAFVLLYAGGYMAGVAKRGRLFAMLFAFMLAMFGAVTADNLILLFLFWEMTSLTSFLLVGFKHEYESARRSAQQALIVTAGGGLVLLAGVILLGEAAGTYSLSGLLASAPQWSDHKLVPWAFACIAVGAFTKSAQFPFHFWLPNAMAAPTPVSAYLHSATMVKLGVYLLARLDPALGDKSWWTTTLVSVGAITAAWSMLLALRERDLKRILAWSTVSALGTLVMLVGLPGSAAPGAVAAFLLAHALYKAPLFFVAGNVDHCTGTRNIDRVCGLASKMPWTAAAAALAAVSMAGMPFSLGFAAKELITVAKYEGEAWAWIGYSGAFVSAVSVAVAGVAAFRVFWHRDDGIEVPPEIHEAGWAMRLPPLLVALIGIAFGLVPALVAPLLDASAAAMQSAGVAAAPTVGELDAPMLGTITLTVVIGIAVFLLWDRLHDALERVMPKLQPVSMQAWYERLLAAIPTLAGAVTRPLQGGRMVAYTAMTVTACGGSLMLLAALRGPEPIVFVGTSAGVALGAALLIAASVLVVRVRQPLLLLLCSGFAGLSSAVLFLFLGAPDVAFTQFTVEVAFIVVLAAVLLRINALRRAPALETGGLWRVFRGGIALGTGAAVTALLLWSTSEPFDPVLSNYFGERSLTEAYGQNVVNVILVDFRALDTLGEIAVVAVTLLAVLPLFALLRRREGAAT